MLTALKWITRSLMIPRNWQSESSQHEERTFLPPVPPTRSLIDAERGISTFSALSLGLSSIGGCSLSSGPATSINEAVRQTDVAVASLTRLREELEKAKMFIDASQTAETKSQCYMCRESADPSLVPVCSACQALNEAKRSTELGFSHLEDDVAFVVTGARIKLGYSTVERLLASGVKRLVLTTRFPFSLAEKLETEHAKDLKIVSVHIYGTDFRNVSSVMALGEHLAKFYPKVFALINNAAQTVRRPPTFYTALVDRELNLARNAGSLANLVRFVGSDPFEDSSVAGDALAKRELGDPMPLVKSFRDCEAFSVCASALMTQCQVLEEDAFTMATTFEGKSLFPESNEEVDASTGELVSDLREFTSWTKSILPSSDADEL